MDFEADNPPVVEESDAIEEIDDGEEQQGDQTEQGEVELDDDGNPLEGPDDEEGDEADDGSDDLEDVEIGGKTYKVPKDAALRQADYTRKTMELAEQRKAVQAMLERVQTVSREETNALAQVAVIDSQLAQYENIDWAAWQAQNPNDALAHRIQFMELQQARAAAVDGYTKAQNEARSIAQRETARRLEEGSKVLAEKIPEWGPDKARALRDFAINDYGFNAEDIDSLDNPLAILVLHDAMEARASRKHAATAKKIEKQQAVKPARTVKGGGAVAKTGLDDRLPADEWVRRRNEQIAKRNR